MSSSHHLQIHINGQETFFINENVVASYSGAMKKMIRKSKRRTQIDKSGIELNSFPGGPDGFELVSRFCHNNGRIKITISNVSLLHCCALFLDMTEKVSPCNLLQETEEFLEGMFYWSFSDMIVSLKSCESFFEYADSSTGIVQKLIRAILDKIDQKSEMGSVGNSSSSSSSSSETPESIKSGSSTNSWWFSEFTILPPNIIEKVVQTMNESNNSVVVTRFLLHYLKTANSSSGYGGLADTAAKGVIFLGSSTFSCRNLFWVLRVLSGSGLSRGCRDGLERLIGGVIDRATLDDLLVSGHDRGGYDVDLVSRLLRLFVRSDGASPQKMKKVGRLIDKYLGEIAPDQNLKISKFLGVAESLPDSSRNCFDGVYRAVDIYLESHPSISTEEKSRLCRCLNYEKLTLEACKDLAKNPRIPPRVAVQALMSQRSSSPSEETVLVRAKSSKSDESQFDSDENEDMRLNLQRMQWRVKQLEKACRDMKGRMSKTVASPSPRRALPWLC